jgi:predicted transcriptional regulator
MHVILSIKPKYAEAILSGNKKCEFRKKILPKKIRFVIIYSTSPVGKIVGTFKIKRQDHGSPSEIWKRHKRNAGITHEEYENYYNQSKQAVCIEIESVNKLKQPIDPYKETNDFVAPQSFRYLKHKDYSMLSTIIEDLKLYSLKKYD